jgi:hypothetical protein
VFPRRTGDGHGVPAGFRQTRNVLARACTRCVSQQYSYSTSARRESSACGVITTHAVSCGAVWRGRRGKASSRRTGHVLPWAPVDVAVAHCCRLILQSPFPAARGTQPNQLEPTSRCRPEEATWTAQIRAGRHRPAVSPSDPVVLTVDGSRSRGDATVPAPHRVILRGRT